MDTPEARANRSPGSAHPGMRVVDVDGDVIGTVVAVGVSDAEDRRHAAASLMQALGDGLTGLPPRDRDPAAHALLVTVARHHDGTQRVATGLQIGSVTADTVYLVVRWEDLTAAAA